MKYILIHFNFHHNSDPGAKSQTEKDVSDESNHQSPKLLCQSVTVPTPSDVDPDVDELSSSIVESYNATKASQQLQRAQYCGIFDFNSISDVTSLL